MLTFALSPKRLRAFFIARGGICVAQKPKLRTHTQDVYKRQEEDSSAMVDLNCVMDDQGRLIEIQGTGEGRPFTLAEQQKLVELCAKGIQELQAIQKSVLE